MSTLMDEEALEESAESSVSGYGSSFDEMEPAKRLGSAKSVFGKLAKVGLHFDTSSKPFWPLV